MSNCLQKLSHGIDAAIAGFFFKLGGAIARKPKTTIGLALLFVMCCVAGAAKYEVENRSEKLWSPQGSEPVLNAAIVGRYYPSDSRSNSMYITTKVAGQNVLTFNALNELVGLESKLRALTVESAGEDGVTKNYGWTDLCASRCLMSSVLDTWKANGGSGAFNATQFQADASGLQAKIQTKGSSFIEYVLGGIVKDGSSNLVSATAARFSFNLKNNQYVVKGKYVDPPAEKWEEEATKLIQAQTFTYITTAPNTKWGNSDESGKAIRGDLAFVGASIMLIVLYLVTQLGNCNAVESRTLLAFGGLLCVGCALGIAYGLGSLFTNYTPVHSVLPFLIMGIGVDDIFVLVNEYDLTTPKEGEKKKNIEQRLSEAMREAGASITVTTLTDFLAFTISSATLLPALGSFCVWAAFAVLGCFILTCTMFAAMMVFDARRQENSKRDCGCCCKPVVRKENLGSCAKGGMLKGCIEKKCSPLFSNNVFRGAVMAIFLGLGAGGASQLVDIKQNFRREWFIPGDSYVQDYYSIEKQYFSHLGSPVGIYTENVDPHANQNVFKEIRATLKNNPQMNPQFELTDWYFSFDNYLTTVRSLAIGSLNKTTFDSELKGYLAGAGSRYAGDVVWDTATPTKLRIVRTTGFLKGLDSATKELNAMNSVTGAAKKLAAASNMPTQMFAFAFTFPTWYQYAIIPEEAIQNIGLTLMAVFIVVLLFIASPAMAFIVTAVVGLVLVDILGFMILWDVDLNGVSVVNLVLAVGLSVDYSAHIGHAFMHKQGTRTERAQKAVSQMGLSVINGAVSTFLAVCLLGLSTSYVFKIFFKMFFLTCVFGAFHGLVFLPTLLSLIGPAPFPEHESETPKDVELGSKELSVTAENSDEAQEKDSLKQEAK